MFRRAQNAVLLHAQKPDFVFRRNGRVHLNRPGEGGGGQFNWPLAAEVCASAAVMLDTPCSEVVWIVLTAHSIRQFPLHFPSRASPCAIRFQLEYRWFHFLSFCCGVGCVYISLPLWPLVDRMTIRWILAGRKCFETDRGKPVQMPPSSHGLPWNRTQFSAVRRLVSFYFFQYICVFIPLFSFILHYFLLRRISIILSIPIWTKKYRHCEHPNYTNHHQGVLNQMMYHISLCL